MNENHPSPAGIEWSNTMTKGTFLLGVRVSMVARAEGPETSAVSLESALSAIRSGKYRDQVAAIRQRYQSTLAEADGDYKQAMNSVDPLKKIQPSVLFAGVFGIGGDKYLIEYSGVLCADLEHLSSVQKPTLVPSSSPNGASSRCLNAQPQSSSRLYSPRSETPITTQETLAP